MTTPSMVSALRSRLARKRVQRDPERLAGPHVEPRRVVGLDQAVADADPAAGQRGDLAVVGDDDDGDAARRR